MKKTKIRQYSLTDLPTSYNSIMACQISEHVILYFSILYLRGRKKKNKNCARQFSWNVIVLWSLKIWVFDIEISFKRGLEVAVIFWHILFSEKDEWLNGSNENVILCLLFIYLSCIILYKMVFYTANQWLL